MQPFPNSQAPNQNHFMTIAWRFLKKNRGTYSSRKVLRLEVVDFLLTQPCEDLRWFDRKKDMDHLLDMIVMTGGISVETVPTLSEDYKQDPVVPKKPTP
jgi:hypothetical protein